MSSCARAVASGYRGFSGVKPGMGRSVDPVSSVVSSKRRKCVVARIAPKVRTQTRARTREVGNTGSWNCTGATRKNGQRHVLARHRQHKRGAPLFGATPPRPLSLVTCRVLVNSGGHSRLPETSDFPSPQLMQRPLSLPVLLACICRSMRLQRMMPIGSSSEFTSPQRSV